MQLGVVPYDLPYLLLVEVYNGLDAVFGLFEVLIHLVANVEHAKHENRDLYDQKYDLVVDHRPKDIFKGIMETYLGGVDEAIIRRDIHVEVSKVLTCSVGWQFIQRLYGRNHIVNEIDLIVPDTFIEAVVLKGVVHLGDVEGTIEDGLEGHWIAH